jgi:DNA/RNA endonuclease YhcR with UshA esterase domain
MKIFEKINFKFCLIASILGIFVLLTISLILEPKKINLDKINQKLLEKQVSVEGKIINVKNFEDSNFQIIKIKKDFGEIDIILNKITNLIENQTVSVIGKVTEYNETLQIQADKIFLLK